MDTGRGCDHYGEFPHAFGVQCMWLRTQPVRMGRQAAPQESTWRTKSRLWKHGELVLEGTGVYYLFLNDMVSKTSLLQQPKQKINGLCRLAATQVKMRENVHPEKGA